MKTFALISAIASMLALTAATPLSSRDATTSSPANVAAAGVVVPGVEVNAFAASTVGLYVCVDADFNGPCQLLASKVGQCYNLYNGFDDTISSLAPHDGATCNLYTATNCAIDQGQLTDIVAPGIWNLGDSRWNFNDRASSYLFYL